MKLDTEDKKVIGDNIKINKDNNEKKVNKDKKVNKEKKNKKNKGLKIFGIVVLVLIIILGLILGSMYMFVTNKLGKINNQELNREDLSINNEVKENLAKYKNIAIFGVDSRSDSYEKGNRSDCIIIASINQETKEVKLISVYRDTYVEIEGHGLDKITHAYSYGEVPLAIKTLNKNFDLNIEDFVTVNFEAVKDIIDYVGGVSMKITSEEVKFIPGITKPGTYNLTGEQALAYSRIRYASGGDYKRTERMRDVLIATANKVKTFNISQLNSLVNKVLPEVYTSLSAGDIFSLLPGASNYKIVDSIGWPYETKGITFDRWYGVPVTLESNVTRLHKEVFEEADYVASDYVKEVSNKIINKTGYGK